ncbi:MAG: ABC transporter permease [Acidobacteriota bacterium]
MAIPIIYNLRSVRVRWRTSIVAVLGIAGAVGVFVAMLALAKGFQATLVASGSPGNAIIRRAGATSEMESVVQRADVDIISTAPGVAKSADGRPLVSAEVVVVASLPRRDTGTDANVQIRGVSGLAMDVRDTVKMVQGRFFRPGVAEMVVGKNALRTVKFTDVGGHLHLGGTDWEIVGVFDAGGSAFDSEIWCDAEVLLQAYKRPQGIYQSLTAHLDSPESLQRLDDSLTSDPRLTVQVDREVDYYAKQSQAMSAMIRVLGFLVAAIMGIGAVFGALNTMYSAVSARAREIATLRAIGFRGGSIIMSFLTESVVISLAGGLVGCLAALTLNGLTVSTLNWQTFSHVAFAFRVTPQLLTNGLIFALIMGVLGGLPPAIRATRLVVASALREL